ncbi:MAG: L-serine ammonia-lyase [Campylobacteraceae bacterium]|nr:L-serine ammonia-lyase [Campylobacteraceae bacterium]
MKASIFDIFKIGIGPSSSHTVGPMVISNQFSSLLKTKKYLNKINKLSIVLYGSLAATGLGHASDVAVLLGLCGKTPQNVDTDMMNEEVINIKKNKRLRLLDGVSIDFDYDKDLIMKMEFLPFHSNAITFYAYEDGKLLIEKTYYSIGGGFVLCEDEINKKEDDNSVNIPYEFNSSKELISLCKKHSLSISELILENEKAYRSEEEINIKLKEIWNVMEKCVEDGCKHDGLMPGRLKVPRRAKKLYEKLSKKANFSMIDPLEVMDWIDLYALAVNEENACGGRVVTAPTNGAAGIVPAVMHYMNRFINKNLDEYDMKAINKFLLTAGAIGMLYQKNASISGADVGCQGEVGVACSMAAGALAEAMGGNVDKVENAAEIGMEHNLGLTCDPIGGYVQIPCIERNAMASMKAVNAARMAINGDGKHHVSLDSVIKTMFETGKDMMHKYKETSLGGLAVNAVEC